MLLEKKYKCRYCLLGILLLFFLVGCKKDHVQYFQESGTRFHTIYHITYQSDRLLTAAIDSTMVAFNSSLNPFDPNSLISQVNRNETEIMDTMLRTVVLKALEVSQQTGGVYDITGSALFDVWGFGTRKGVTREATQAELDSIAAFVGYQKIKVSGDSLLKSDPRITLNPSSLSKGYVVDLVAATLEAHGVENYLVEIGGEIVAKGVNPDGKCWRLGINRPIEDSAQEFVDEIVYSLNLCERGAMATSGDYRNYKLLNGKKVAHTIDVLTGRPAHQDILSATVVAPTCMEADAWATAFMALGMERSMPILDQHPTLSVCFIYTDPNTNSLEVYNKGLQLTEVEK